MVEEEVAGLLSRRWRRVPRTFINLVETRPSLSVTSSKRIHPPFTTCKGFRTLCSLTRNFFIFPPLLGHPLPFLHAGSTLPLSWNENSYVKAHPKRILLIASIYIYGEKSYHDFSRIEDLLLARIKRRVHAPPKSLLPPTRGKFITEKRGEGRSPDRFWPASPPLVRSNVCRFTTRKRGVGERRLCITFTHNVVCQQPPPLRENVIPSHSRTFRGLMFAGFIGRATHQPRSQKGWLCLCFFFFTSSNVCVYERGRRALNGDGCGHCWVSLSFSPLCSRFSPSMTFSDISFCFFILRLGFKFIYWKYNSRRFSG